VNKLRLQIASKKTFFAIDHQGKTINTNVAKVQAQNVVFWLLDDNGNCHKLPYSSYEPVILEKD
jgi:hypothetical protein